MLKKFFLIHSVPSLPLVIVFSFSDLFKIFSEIFESSGTSTVTTTLTSTHTGEASLSWVRHASLVP